MRRARFHHAYSMQVMFRWGPGSVQEDRRLSDPCHALESRCRHTYRTAHAGAAEAAITIWILCQILLVMILGVVERRSLDDLGRDLAIAGLVEALLEGLARLLRGAALLRRGDVDAGAVLRADVVALAHALGRIMA